MTTFSASLMCGDLLNLENEIEILKQHDIDYLHMDIMDGHFVPNTKTEVGDRPCLGPRRIT